MQLEQQVCTLEQAKRLKELGIVGNTEFYWRGIHVWHYREVTDWPNQETMVELMASKDEEFQIFSAFTVAELGVMINWERCSISPPMPDDPNWWIFFNEADLGRELLSECMADALIYQLENKLTTPEECNQRLTQ